MRKLKKWKEREKKKKMLLLQCENRGGGRESK